MTIHAATQTIARMARDPAREPITLRRELSTFGSSRSEARLLALLTKRAYVFGTQVFRFCVDARRAVVPMAPKTGRRIDYCRRCQPPSYLPATSKAGCPHLESTLGAMISGMRTCRPSQFGGLGFVEFGNHDQVSVQYFCYPVD
jgi:hypothetical protein